MLERLREVGGLPQARLGDEGAARGADDDTVRALVVRVVLADDKALLGERGDQTRGGGPLDALAVGELRRGERAVALDGGQRGAQRRREPGVGAMAQPAGEAGRGEPDAVGELGVADGRCGSNASP
ncbi:MAG: hypothetical protein JWM31_591 [Solirubrobacterales bacterium]|nr:hypothetical protein [Solirubrobacterales bacterium]